MTIAADRLPAEYRPDIDRAVRILRQGGCTEVHLFGSIAEGRMTPGSDIDLAVRGCPPEKFFALLGELMVELEHAVDLVDLDADKGLAEFLQQHAELLHVG